jgi:hypothetical protein
MKEMRNAFLRIGDKCLAYSVVISVPGIALSTEGGGEGLP